jgi:rhamnose utilization protein RhaD (predicted bifunctional aldolase and dehydrogenase)
MSSSDILEQLITLSNHLGEPERDCAILGEGNTSGRADDRTFWVKASGAELRTITARGFVQVVFDRILALLEGPALTDQQVKDALAAAKADPAAPGHPSVETLLHAQLLCLEGVNFVGHTHPTAVNVLTCSAAFPDIYKGRLFPDEIVLCGVAPLIVSYTDPGIPLARHIHSLLRQYLDEYGQPPRMVLMQNHGLIALGRTAKQVEDITLMAVKTARILAGAAAIGGPRYLSTQDVGRIHTRPDELYRRQKLGLEKDSPV